MKERDPRTFSGSRMNPSPEELEQFIELLQRERVESYVEIGAEHGDTFHAVMSALPPGARGIAIDMPEGPWGKRKSQKSLLLCIEDLRAKGYDAHAIIGDSNDSHTRLEVARLFGQYLFEIDAILIDGDHSYQGVKSDWDNWGPTGRIVAFHEIEGGRRKAGKSNLKVEVPTLWDEICIDAAFSGWKTERIIAGEPSVGIGVVLK